MECWGANEYGELGDGTTTEKATPVEVSGLSSGVAAIAAGGDHTCALTSAGAVECWGKNEFRPARRRDDHGQNDAGRRQRPERRRRAISAGYFHTCALTIAGGVECWGYNEEGELGDGTFTNKATPVEVSGLSGGVAAISAGEDHTCALRSAGGVECWGNNGYGALGDGTTTNKTTPTGVIGLARATCTTNTGTLKLAPGLSATPAVQTVKIKGTLAGCTSEPFTETKYSATLKTPGPVSCSVLKATGETATGSAKYKWTPSAKASKGTLAMLLTETPGAAFSGEVTSGTYAPLMLSGTATESYNGAATCSTTTVKKGVFSGSAVNVN